jgi:polysaccharide pyruvyl transferase WcaK-like protein
MDLVLGMRKHSLIIPIGQGVPVIGLGDMDEVRWILEDVGLGEWLITSRSTAAQADELVRRAAAGEQPAVDLAGMRAVTDAFNARVVALAERTVVV